jgi:hypothetical protein
MGAVSASQFHKGPSGGQSQAGACRDRGTLGGARGRLEGLVAGEHVPGGDQDLARDRDRGLGGVVVVGAAADVGVELVPGGGFAPGLLGGLDRGPAEQPRAGLAERAAARSTFTRLVDAWSETSVGDELLRTGEAADLADLDRDRQREQFGDSGNRVQEDRARVGLREWAQLGVQRRDRASRKSISAKHSPAERRQTSGTPARSSRLTPSGRRRRASETRTPHCERRARRCSR